ncbi:MAG: NAD-dependent epimerase/dehydratase family protein [Acidobacteriia bacterium]|nr:NAD-dependent epimerase/dehydratase family protein [Terriglobia bacterium]
MTELLPARKLRAGIAGAGYVSAYHIRAVQSLDFAEVVAIADVDLQRAREVAGRFHIPAACGSLEEMRAASPDMIHVLTPPGLHCDLAVRALEMGCHVMVEKPMANTVEECDRMITAARRNGRTLTVNHSARMDPIVLEALQRVREGEVGKVLAVDFLRSSDYPPYTGGPLPPPYRNGAYPLQDIGVHGLYLLEAFLGPVRSADIRYASTGRDVKLLFDEWRATVNCENGTGHMYLSWNERPMQNLLIVHGTLGVMQVDCFLQCCTVRKAYSAPKPVQIILGAVSTSVATLAAVTRNTFRFATGKLVPSPGIHRSVCEFYRSVAAGLAPPVSPGEARRIIEVLQPAAARADADWQRFFAPSRSPGTASVLVTGAGGFIGRALINRLRESGKRIRVLSRRPIPGWDTDSDLQVVYGDLGDPEIVHRAVEGVSTVYHVGAAMKGGIADFHSATVVGTQNVVDAALKYGIRRLVHVSSITVLDYAGHRGAPMTEESPMEPHPEWRGAYTESKLRAERIVLDAIGKGLQATIVRPGQIFGPGAEMLPPYGTIALAGRWVVVGTGNILLPLVYIDDVVDALVLAAQRDGVCGKTFQLVDRERLTQRQYIDHCRERHGQKIRVVYVPRPAFYAAGIGIGALGRLLRRSVPLSRYRVSSIRGIETFDCSAARELLGWAPRIGVKRGMKLMCSPPSPASHAALIGVA